MPKIRMGTAILEKLQVELKKQEIKLSKLPESSIPKRIYMGSLEIPVFLAKKEAPKTPGTLTSNDIADLMRDLKLGSRHGKHKSVDAHREKMKKHIRAKRALAKGNK